MLEFDRDTLIYTPFYCEENIWKLCEKIRNESPEELSKWHTVFISNHDQTLALFCQSLGKPQRHNLVFWDYHVIAVYHDTNENSFVFDYDTTLPFKTRMADYLEEVFREHFFSAESYCQYAPLFRVIPAGEYLQSFSSDRSRMRNPDGTYLKPPPAYSYIRSNQAVANNIDEFISMSNNSPVGTVMTLKQLKETFLK